MSNHTPASTLLGKIATYTEILARDPKSTVFVPLADAYRSMGLLDDARDIALQGTLAHPCYPAGFIVMGRIQLAQRRLADARQSFEKALNVEPDNVEALKELARLHRLEKEDAPALGLLSKAAVLAPEDEDIREQLAQLTAEEPSVAPLQQNLSAVAKPAAAESLEQKRAEPITTATIAEIYIRQGFLRRALKVYRDLLRADPHNETVRQKLVALKERILETEGAAVDDEDLEGVVAAAPASPVESSESPTPRAIPTAGAVSRPDVLSILNGWLESIHRRKMDVR